MIQTKVFQTLNDASGIIYVPAAKSVQTVISGVGQDGIVLTLQKSTDGATWSTITTFAGNGTTKTLVSASTAYFVRLLCTTYAGTPVLVGSIANVLDVTGLQAFAVGTVDYLWDFAIQGGALSDIILQPSKLLPSGAVAYWLIRKTITPTTGAGAAGLGVTGSQGCLETNSLTPATVSLATATLLQGIAIADGLDVKFNITGSTLTAGKLQWTLFYLYPTF